MTNAEALRRAKAAAQKACDDTDGFNNGDMASHEVMGVIKDALEKEFKAAR